MKLLARARGARKFCRVGERRENACFHGKIIAATNRDLAAEMRAGRFRTDLYYRLNADIVRTPSLRERLADSGAELPHLITFLLQRSIGDEAEAAAPEAEAWIHKNLGPDYPWPGNVRELEQCLRNLLIRLEYHPAEEMRPEPSDDPWVALAKEMNAQTLSAEALLRRYCTLVYRTTGSYESASQVLQLDRRTVKAKVDAQT